MTALAEVFLANHSQALRHGESLDAGKDGTVASSDRIDLGEFTDLEIERLIEIAADAVHAGGIDPTVEMVDVDHESLLEIPSAAARVLAELSSAIEQPDGEKLDVIPEVAKAWAEDEDIESEPGVTEPLVRKLVALAVSAASQGASLYLWMSA